MSALISTKPYMVRAIHEWCVDNGFTPHLMVAVNPQTRVPMAFVKHGEIVLNINYSATKDLHMDNEAIVFSARFSGVSHNMYVPMSAVKGIFARENGQGMFFELEDADLAQPTEFIESNTAQSKEPLAAKAQGKPTLKIVK